MQWFSPQVSPDKGLGISIRGGKELGLGIYISSVDQGSPADEVGLVVRADQKTATVLSPALLRMQRLSSACFPLCLNFHHRQETRFAMPTVLTSTASRTLKLYKF